VLTVLRAGQEPITFTAINPENVAHRIAHTIGRPAVDAWAPELGSVPARLRDELSHRLPEGETLLGVAPSPDSHGIAALTSRSLLWIHTSPLVFSRWDPTEAIPNLALDPALQSAVCELYRRIGYWAQLVSFASRCTISAADVYKAEGLARTGMQDAALVTYDDVIRKAKKKNPQLEQYARYRKSAFLVDLGDVGRARRELARLYADNPFFDDYERLMDKVKSATSSPRREPIPERVRHAVWRRDHGRCVQCGSNEQLEFDHIIPLSRGGSSTERNLQLLCAQCNRAKGSTV
jgi:hypothetical protein